MNDIGLNMSQERRIYHEKLEKDHVVAEGKLNYNFSPGPCVLPKAVLDEAAKCMHNYKGSGQSVMELSHRKPHFLEISDNCKNDISKMIKVPDDYTIMLNQGGATS